MAKEKVYSEVLNLRVDEAMSKEIKRIATQRGAAESEAARMLIEWGIEAHRVGKSRCSSSDTTSTRRTIKTAIPWS